MDCTIGVLKRIGCSGFNGFISFFVLKFYIPPLPNPII
jgi:hypothetical protein